MKPSATTAASDTPENDATMRFCVLGSGSKGNATFVEAGNTRILIDAGFSGKETDKRLAAINIEPESLSAIIITHEHSDHIKGAGVLSRKYNLPIWANAATFAAAPHVLTKLFATSTFETGTAFSLGGLSIHPYSVSHDAADPVGFFITNGSTNLGYCTDTGVLSRLIRFRLANCHGLVLECNHDPHMLKNGPYPPSLQQRVRGKEGHLANGDAARFLSEILHDGLNHVVLAHLSDANNLPELAHGAISEMLAVIRNEAGHDCPLPKVSVALQDKVGELIELSQGQVD